MFYSKSTGGFYDDAIHGSLFIEQVNVDLDGVTTDRFMVPDPDGPIADAVEITANEHASLLNGQNQGKQIVVDENGYPVLVDPPGPTVADVWAKIKVERDRRTDIGGFEVDGKWFHSDQKSRNQQLGLVLLGSNIPAGLQWKTMDGSFVTMTRTLAGQILAAGAASDTAIFAAAEDHKAALEACENPSDYDYLTGWPKIFGE